MACRNCSCGGSHGSGRSSKTGMGWVMAGIAGGFAVLIGATMALQPSNPIKPQTPPMPKSPANPTAPPEKEIPKPEQPGAKPDDSAHKGVPEKDRTAPAEKPSPYVLGYTMKRLDGSEESLETYKGKVVMIVNVASKCGLTPQYEALEKLYQDKKDSGLVILGFPANNFGSQEPGTNKEIAEFCSSKYHVTFPMFEKISVKGEDQHPLYKQLTAQPAPIGGDPKWNFTKFIVDRKGNVVARFEPKTKPDDAELVKKIDELLAAKP